MIELKGRGITGGQASGPALVAHAAINFTAALSSVISLIPGRQAENRDRHHELFGQNMAGKVLVFPTCIGSTFTGMVLMQLMYSGNAPAAMIVTLADSLMVSGAVLAEVWFNAGIPILEVPPSDLARISTGDAISLDARSGVIKVAPKASG